MLWNQVFIPLCYRYFLLNQKKRRCEICILETLGPEIKKRNGIEMALPILFNQVTVFKNSHKQTQKIFQKYALSCT